jgi:histone H3/H4
MRQTRSAAAQTIGSTENAEDILAQFYYAFGQGAGTMRVERAAVGALRRRYFNNIKAAPAPWNAMAGNVLQLLAQVGRLAALFATQAGRAAITEADFMRARKAIESTVHPRANDTGRLIAGPICSIVPGEDEHDDAAVDMDEAPETFDIQQVQTRTN